MDLIIGGGTYGELALHNITGGTRHVIVIDEDPDCTVQKKYGLPESSVHNITSQLPEKESSPGKAVFIEGGMESAARLVINIYGRSGSQGYNQGRVFPTAPVHISAGIISEICGFVPDPEGAKGAAALIPEDLIIGKKDADIYCSLNREKPCHPRCPAPEVCPVTGERRDTPLWETLRNCLSGDEKAGLPYSVVIESQQLSAGLGYIDSSDLIRAIEGAGKEDTLLAVTACRCHGVVTALKKV